MARRALLIGSQTGGLIGVDNDIVALSKALDRWEFSSVRCQAENASRAGIIDAYERLIAETVPGDAVVVHYSGHGGYSRTQDGRSAVQFIVPTDYAASTPGDFRGIMAVELSVLLARLTEKTTNVTVTLDCCHSAHLSRDQDLIVRAITRPVSHHVIANHLDHLRRHEPGLDLLTPQGNRHAVRVVACAPEQPAYERDNDAGVHMGLFTDALTAALTEARDGESRISWASVIDRIRQRVLTVEPRQRPEAEGPAQRLLFDVREADPVATLPVTMTADIVRIGGAPLLGVRPGDEFVIMPGDAPEPVPARRIGDVVVTKVDTTAAWGRLRPVGRVATMPIDARAHLVRTAAPTLPVGLPDVAALTRAVEAAPLVRAAEPAERGEVAVTVDGAGELVVGDRFGPLRAARPADAAGIDTVVRDLTRLARAHALRGLAERQLAALDSPIAVEFGLVDSGQPRPLSPAGAVLHVDQPIYVRVRNDGAQVVYVSLLDIGVAARITLLNPSSPGGERLAQGEGYVFGGNDLTGALPGVSLSWPAELPADTPRPETIMVLVTSEPVDARVLEQQGVRGGTDSFLARFLTQLRTGDSRDLAPSRHQSTRFAVHTIDFDLMPSPPATAETIPFQVDDRPSAATVLWHRGPATPPTVTLRLDALVAHHGRTFLGADLRLDLVTVTGDDRRTTTACLTAVADGQRRTVPDPVVYHGPIVDRLDLAVWISAGARTGHSLADPLPPAIGETGEWLRSAFRETVGVYRTTLLAGEQGGTSTVRARDFSLTFDIAVEPAVLSVRE
ncbi:caspase family protein [Actinophytocola sediminis]